MSRTTGSSRNLTVLLLRLSVSVCVPVCGCISGRMPPYRRPTRRFSRFASPSSGALLPRGAALVVCGPWSAVGLDSYSHAGRCPKLRWPMLAARGPAPPAGPGKRYGARIRHSVALPTRR